MTRIRLAAIGTLLLGAALLTAGCSTAPGQVFADSTGSGEGLRDATTVDIVDVGLYLHNLTGHTVRVLRISLAPGSPGVRLVSASAYPGPPDLGIGRGDMIRLCRTSHPLTDAATAPHADSRWDVVLAFRFTRPGRYSLGPVRIYYATNGQKGWQYEHLDATVSVIAARPGTMPRFDGCP